MCSAAICLVCKKLGLICKTILPRLPSASSRCRGLFSGRGLAWTGAPGCLACSKLCGFVSMFRTEMAVQRCCMTQLHLNTRVYCDTLVGTNVRLCLGHRPECTFMVASLLAGNLN